MDVFNLLESMEVYPSERPINSQSHMMPLKRVEYDYIYRELKYRDTYYFKDGNGIINFLVKIMSARQIETVMKGSKRVSVFRDINGPGIELNIGGLEAPFYFLFDLNDVRHLGILKKIMENKEVYMHFILYNDKQCIKSFSALLNIDDRIQERLIYMIRVVREVGYPRLDFKEYGPTEAYYLLVESNISVLEDLLKIADNLQKWGSKDCFSVYISEEDGYKIFFSGEVININYLKSEILKKVDLKCEGYESPNGKPFFKYDRGMLYFYNSEMNT